jgi:hypothetical protein
VRDNPNNKKVFNKEAYLNMEEKELLRIKGERKVIGTLEYYNIIVTNKRIVIGKVKRTHLKLGALLINWNKYKNMTPEEVIKANKENFAINFEDLEFVNSLLKGTIILRNQQGQKRKIILRKRDYQELKRLVQSK